MADQPETTDPQAANPESASPTGKPSGGSWWYPLLAVLLSAALITQIVYLVRQVKTPTPSTPRVAKGGSGQPKGSPNLGGPGPGPSGPSAPGPGASGRPGPPAVNETPYVGLAPTTDPSTWAWVPGNLLLGALKRVDGEAGMALTAEQCKQFQALFTEAAPLGRAQAEADQRLTRQAQSILNAQQIQEIQSKQKELVGEAFDGEALVSALKTLGAKASASAAPDGGGEAQGDMVPIVLLVGLNYLQKNDKLTPAQAAQLEPLVSAYVDALKAVATKIYPRVPKILNEKQLKAFVAILGEMHSGKIDPATAQVTAEEMGEYLKPRLQ